MRYSAGEYDLIVIGAGHSGCEAALAAARMGCQTLVVTISFDSVALMPCNPSIGGPAKGHLVREIDALGGQMAISADCSSIQMRMLNTSKGPAVRALRSQSDKWQYQSLMRRALEREPNLDIKQAVVDQLLYSNGRISGVLLNTGASFSCKAVVLTTGTYLRGKITMGKLIYDGGPNGQYAPKTLAKSLKDLGLKTGRFRTTTPARINRNTIDFSKMIEQTGDSELHNFSYRSPVTERKQLSSWLTYTTPRTHDIIRENLDKSPFYLAGKGSVEPRYCPSIETKISRFPDRERHQIFIEPEGWHTNEMYVQGLYTSFGEELQLELLRSVPGLGNVKIIRPGYGIEYDYIIPSQLKSSLEVKGISGLFSAGQINGSSGYEEAAAQGLMAGINAALFTKDNPPLVLSRSDAYIGVLVDDLVTKGTQEPYRMLTSRAEYRLLLRFDNADLRLTEKGFRVGAVGPRRYRAFLEKYQMVDREKERLASISLTPSADVQKLLKEAGTAELNNRTTLAELLRRPEVSYDSLLSLPFDHPELAADIREQVEIQLKYAGYIEKQIRQVERFNKMERKLIPGDVDYAGMKNISLEAREKLAAIRPRSIGQASRISGVNPADITALLIYMEKRRRQGVK
ncbi:MAG TPA: tRNA uridine-5-carboxymethylaminomethyl(34) synthesis enzyme MnmG [Clostridia bacterium]|nr:tRNA uridine-5-carboxymethylaminomethyl(34) synthesis enzyme MnmG [Clostridia bacterium]